MILQDKVIYLYCFQSWCPGCHSHGIPTLKMVKEQFEDASDLVFVAVQTVFEGFNVNTLEAAKKTAERHTLTIPIGHDAPNGERSNIMNAYKTGGTPWTVIIDKNSRIQFEGFHAQPGEMSRLISALRESKWKEDDKHVKF